MSLPLQVIEGIFTERGDTLVVSRDQGDVDIGELLTNLLGKTLEISLHHYPISLEQNLPGGGSCLWNGFCPHGHRERPGWLFQQQLSGVLTSPSSGRWCVGGTPLDLSKMPGHQGRLVLMNEDALQDPDSADAQSPDDLIREASELLQLLEGLQKAVKDE
jgi:hypothetical protein